jgi:hypothetical protein
LPNWFLGNLSQQVENRHFNMPNCVPERHSGIFIIAVPIMFKKFRRLVMVIYISFVIPVKSALPSIMDWKANIVWYPLRLHPNIGFCFHCQSIHF